MVTGKHRNYGAWSEAPPSEAKAYIPIRAVHCRVHVKHTFALLVSRQRKLNFTNLLALSCFIRTLYGIVAQQLFDSTGRNRPV
jgi:hypothetical protein